MTRGAFFVSNRYGKCARENVSNQFSQRTFKISLWRQRETNNCPVISSAGCVA
jgi:hypothetical protein